jgi:formylglycine-generating enzyme required for sulfatase activity/predicted Ser/Thr protein kinase
MPKIEAIHPPVDRLEAYAQGRLGDPEMDEIELHLSACDSCCQVVRDQAEDSLVAKLLGRGAATIGAAATDDESATEPPLGFQVPSSFVVGPAAAAAHHDQPTIAGPSTDPPVPAGLPKELNDHPRYRVVAALGAGGMGAVYRAEHRLMDRPVALKVIRGDLLGNEAMVERFRREVKAAARLASHPNIVVAYDAEQAGDTHMLVMEFIEGTDLARVVDRRGPLPVGEACEYARQAALGLQRAFEDGMVHRDIKPQNLMRTTRGQIKILDFGLARFASEVASQGGLTAEGMILGSADYIAPEQIEDPHAADTRADIYSLGCTLYFLLAGQPPFPDGSLIQKLLAQSEKTPRALAEVRCDVPPELARVVERMMAKDPAQRFQTPDQVARALAPFADTEGARNAATSPDAFASGGAPTLPAASSRRQGAPAAKGWVRAEASTLGATSPAVAPSLGDERPKHRTPEPGLRIWWAAVGLLLLGFFVVWAVLLRVRTANGMIELVDLPKDAEVLVDDEKVAVIWPGGGEPAVVTVTPGKHKIMVKKDGIETSGDEVTVQADSKEKFTVRFVGPAKPKVDSFESIKNSIGMTLKLIPAGEFFMGSPDDAMEAENDEKPAHRVRISKPFYLGACEVTQGQYEAVMSNNPSHFSANGKGKDRVAKQSTDQYPVEMVSWLDAIQFSNKLSEKEGRKPFYEIDGKEIRVPDWNGQGYRLPTEAEWEYACRAIASSPTRFSFGDNPVELGAYGWFDGNSEQRTHPVAQKRPNVFGLYDMHGNVWELCWDWYLEDYYNQSPADDPTGPAGASRRVSRGGCWSNRPRDCRSANRGWDASGDRYYNTGFRLALGQSGR